MYDIFENNSKNCIMIIPSRTIFVQTPELFVEQKLQKLRAIHFKLLYINKTSLSKI